MAVKSHTSPKPTPQIIVIDQQDPDTPVYDRKKLLQITGSLIQETYDRVSGDRFRVREGDRERLQYLRTLRDLIALQAVLLKDAHAPRLDGLELPLDRLLSFRD